MHMGFRMNLSRPMNPIYFERQPADQRRIRYSTPKKATRQISWKNEKKGKRKILDPDHVFTMALGFVVGEADVSKMGHIGL